MRMRGHRTSRRQRGLHLIHRFAMCDSPTRDAGTDFNCRIFSFPLQDLTRDEIDGKRNVDSTLWRRPHGAGFSDKKGRKLVSGQRVIMRPYPKEYAMNNNSYPLLLVSLLAVWAGL